VGNDLAGPPPVTRVTPAGPYEPAEPAEPSGTEDAAQAVTALYREHALGLTRLAFVMLGDRHAAEDVVQDAFCGLYRAWGRLPSHDRALGYVRISVLNGCRSVQRRARRTPRPAAVRLLPPRQREALVLRYFAGLTEAETAEAMRVSRGTVKSTTARALAAVGRMLREEQ
jgi:DNA-directed RNA polymerase specialized sigma24 family protein